MKELLSLVALAAVTFASPAFAADPIVGIWKLNVEKSKFNPDAVLTAGRRIYSEANGLYMFDEKLTRADGKEISIRAQYRNGKDVKDVSATSGTETTFAKKIDANTWDFDLKQDGKVVGHVHRVVSAAGKTLTVHNTGAAGSVAMRDETLVFDKQGAHVRHLTAAESSAAHKNRDGPGGHCPPEMGPGDVCAAYSCTCDPVITDICTVDIWTCDPNLQCSQFAQSSCLVPKSQRSQ